MKTGEVIELGKLVVGDLVIGKMFGVCIVKHKKTPKALVAVEYSDGDVKLMIVPIGKGDA